MSWKFGSQTIDSIEQFPEGAFGFIYNITNVTKARQYIGKKQLFNNRSRKISKAYYEKIKKEGADVFKTRDKKKSKKGNPVWIYKRREVKESNWLTYCGSNKQLIEDISQGDEIVKEIWDIAMSSKELSFLEEEALWMMKVLRYPEAFYNDNIGGRYFSGDLSPSQIKS